jgi:predicted DNA-binding transcriptional regulator AlpA
MSGLDIRYDLEDGHPLLGRRLPDLDLVTADGRLRTIRRHELRLTVPLADSTIYEMEKRGEFPRRFNLTPRCVVWDLAEVEAWLEQRRTREGCSRP